MELKGKYLSSGVIILVAVAIVYYGNYRVTSTLEYKAALNYVNSSLEIRNSIGKVANIKFIGGGSTLFDDAKNAVYEFTVAGENKEAHIIAWVFKSRLCGGFMIKSKFKHVSREDTNIEEVCQL